MSKIFTKKRILMYVPLLFFILLLVIGTFFDFEIAESIGVNKSWITSMVTAFFPVLPYGLLALIGGMAFRLTLDFDKKFARIFFYVVAAGSYGVASFMTFHEMVSGDGLGLEGEMISLLVLGICVIMDFGFAYLGFCLADKITVKMPDLWIVIIFMVVLAGIVVGGGFILKAIFHRARYEFLLSVNSPLSVDDFTRWFEECPSYETYKDLEVLDEAFKSFPSGHVAATALLLTYFPFVAALIPNVRRHTVAWFVVAIVLTVVMIGVRLAAGSHYLSDCAFAAILGYLPFLVGYEIFFHKVDDFEFENE